MSWDTYIGFNGRYKDSKDNTHFCNAHLAYKGHSVIVDYEWCLHLYDKGFQAKAVNTIVPFEGDIGVSYAKLSTYNKVDLSDLISKLDNIIEEEIKAHETE